MELKNISIIKLNEVLNLLYQNNGLLVSKLCRKAAVYPYNSLLKDLEKANVVISEHPYKDKRRRMIKLTELGVKLVNISNEVLYHGK